LWEALEKESRPVLHALGDALLLHRVRSQRKRISVQRDPPVTTHLPRMIKTNPKSTGNDEEGAAYMVEELALEAEGSGPVRVSRTSVFCEDDDEAYDFVGGGFFAMQEVVEVEQEDAEDAGDAPGAMPMAGSAESKAGMLLESSGGSENVEPAVECVNSPGIGSDAWNEPILNVVRGEKICVRASSCAEPCDMV
jgi:hypothetical protein